MINVTDETKAAYLNQNSKQLTITFPDANITLTNSDIVTESLKLTQTLESGNNLSFVGCNAAQVEFQSRNITDDLRGQKVVISINCGETEDIPLFVGTIDTQNNLTHEDINTSFVAYDDLYRINNTDVAEWYKALTFPISIKDMRDSLCSYLNVSQREAELEFDGLTVNKTIDPEQMSGLEVLGAICQMNVVYGVIDREGYLNYVALEPILEPTGISKTEYNKTTYEPFTVANIDKVVIREDSDDVGGMYGSGTNAFVIEGNFLFYGMSAAGLETSAQRIYRKVANIVYVPFELDCIGMPYIELGDSIEYHTETQTVNSYVLNRSLSGIQNLTDKYSASGTKLRDSQVNSVSSQIKQLASRTNRLSRDVEQTQSQLTNYQEVTDGTIEELSNTITQTAESLEVQISDIYKELDGSINVYYTEEEPNLLNYPAWDFSFSLPCNDTIKCSDDIKLEYNNDYYKKFSRSIAYDNNGGMSYRFKKGDNEVYFWEEVADTEFGVLMQKVTNLEVTADGLTSDVSAIYADVDGLQTITDKHSTEIKQTSDSITLEANRAKTAEQGLSSSIQINANAITSKVSKGNVSSEISQEAGQVSIKSNRLVVDSTYFKLSADGTLNATNANISGYTKTADLQANYATISNLNATQASLSSLAAVAITTNNLSAQSINASQIKGLTISASQITSGTINASRISTNTFSGRNLDCAGLTSSSVDTDYVDSASAKLYTLNVPDNFTFKGHALKLISYGSYYFLGYKP